MAIRFTYTDERTGAVLPNAHLIVADPVFDAEKKTVTIRGTVYANKAAYDAKKEPVYRNLEQTFPVADYSALRATNLAAVEPALIVRFATFFVGGVRVAD